LRYTKPARVLRPGGVLAVARCNWAVPTGAHPFWRDVQEDYQAVGAEGDPPPPPEAIGVQHLPSEARAHFEEVAALRYPFAVGYSAGDYLANLRTQTVTRQLGEEARAEFLTRVEVISPAPPGSELQRLKGGLLKLRPSPSHRYLFDSLPRTDG
jgi:hypothetical protein